MLHNVNIDRKGQVFCGPWAMAALTGLPITKVEEAIRDQNFIDRVSRGGRRLPVRGTYPTEVLKALNQLGYRTVKVGIEHNGKTLKKAYELMKDFHNKSLLVMVKGHWMVIRRGVVTDTVVREPISLELMAKGRRRQFEQAYVVEKM